MSACIKLQAKHDAYCTPFGSILDIFEICSGQKNGRLRAVLAA